MMTAMTFGMSSPRAATSVATRTWIWFCRSGRQESVGEGRTRGATCTQPGAPQGLLSARSRGTGAERMHGGATGASLRPCAGRGGGASRHGMHSSAVHSAAAAPSQTAAAWCTSLSISALQAAQHRAPSTPPAFPHMAAQHAAPASIHTHGLERVQHVVALLLALVTVDGSGAELARNVVAQLVAHALGGAEDHDALAGLGAQDLLQLGLRGGAGDRAAGG